MSKLLQLQQAQHEALQAGDPADVTTATQAMLCQALRRLAQVQLAEGHTSALSSTYQQLFLLDESADAHLEYASSLLRSGSALLAAEQAKVATTLDPNLVSAWVIEGSALRAGGKEEDAVAAYQRALSLRQDINIAYALASTELALHDEAKAKLLFQQIFTASDNAAIWHVAAGDAYREERYLTLAIQEFETALKLDPKAPHAEFFLGLTYLQLSEWGPTSQSFEHLQRAVHMAPQEYASNFYLGALESTDGSDLASSDTHLRAAAEADPTQPEVWLYLGLNANREHRTEEAETHLRKAIALTGEDDARNNYQVRRAYFALGRLLLAQGKRDEGEAMLARYRKDEQAAVASSGSAIVAAELKESSSATVPEVGTALSTNSKVAITLSSNERAQLKEQEAKLQELLADGYNDLGVSQARTQQLAAAVTSFKQGESWHPPTPALLRNLGTAAFRAGDYPETIRALTLYQNSISEQGRQDATSTLMLAVAEFSLGHFQVAANHFDTVRDQTLADDRATYSWASSLVHTGQMVQVTQLADKLSSRPLFAEVSSLVCHLYLEAENYTGAIGCYRKALSTYPGLALAHYQIGQAMIHLDQPLTAVDEFEQELRLTPDNIAVAYAKAFALLQVPEKEKARRLLLNIVEKQPDQAEAQYQLGKLLLEEGKPEVAIDHLERSAQADPTPDYVHYQLGTAYRKAGRGAEAERELLRYRQIKEHKRSDAVVPPVNLR